MAFISSIVGTRGNFFGSRGVATSAAGLCCTCFALRPRMVFTILSLEMIEGHVGVNLGRGNVSMSQDGLHRPQVRALLHHVSSAAMAQHVRRGVTSGMV